MLEGIPTVLVGIVAFCFLDGKVADAKWLSPAQKQMIQRNLLQEVHSQQLHSVKDALTNPRVLLGPSCSRGARPEPGPPSVRQPLRHAGPTRCTILRFPVQERDMQHDHSFATLPLPPHQRVAGWTRAVSDRFVESGFDIAEPEGFDAAMLNRDVAALSLTRFRSGGHGRKRVTRSQRQAARGTEEFYLLGLQLEGRGAVCQAGREVWLSPGEFALYDTRRPYALVYHADYQQAVLRIPRRDLVARLGDCDALVATAAGADALPARLLQQMLCGLCETPAGRIGAAGDLADALLGLVAAGLRGLRGDAPVPALQRLEHIQARARERLHDPHLTPGTLAEATGVSLRRLHQLFQVQGCTPARWIWQQRLAACERALRDPAAARRTLTQIAFDHGFSDSAHFSRAFQQRYGRSPSEHRRRHCDACKEG